MRLVYPFADHVTRTPTPIRRVFPWQQSSMEQCTPSQAALQALKWSLGGMCASHRITAQRSRLFLAMAAVWKACASTAASTERPF